MVNSMSNTNHERWDVHKASANPNVALEDGAAGVVNAEGEAELVGDGLEAAVKEFGDGERKHVIELELVVREETVHLATTENSSSLELTAVIILWERKQETGSRTELSKSALNTPDLTLASKAILTAQLQLLNKTLPLESTFWH